MSNPFWQNNKPDLSRLPPHLKETLKKPVEIHEDEFYSKLLIYKQHSGYNHPRARTIAGPWVVSPNPESPPQYVGVTIDMKDFSGKVPVASLGVDLKSCPKFMYTFIKMYLNAGGTYDTVQNVFNDLEREYGPRTDS